MAEVKEKPSGLPSGNDLDKFKAEPRRAELRLGQNVLLASDDPPELCETVDVVLRLRVKRKGTEMLSDDADGEVVAFRSMKLVTAWIAGQKPPSPPTMVDDEGNIDPAAVAEGTDPRTGSVNHLAAVPDPDAEPGDDQPPI